MKFPFFWVAFIIAAICTAVFILCMREFAKWVLLADMILFVWYFLAADLQSDK